MKGKFREKDFQTKFGHWLINNKKNETYELKIVKEGKPFSFDRVKEHQLNGLLKSIMGIYIKIPDTSSKTGRSNKKPFDCCFIIAEQAWVAVMFYVPKKRQYFYRIPVCHFMELKDCWRRKSISEEEFALQPGVEKFWLQ